MRAQSLFITLAIAFLVIAVPGHAQGQMQSRAPIVLPEGDAKPIVQ